MKMKMLGRVLLALELTLALPAIAQDTTKKDPIPEKKATLPLHAHRTKAISKDAAPDAKRRNKHQRQNDTSRADTVVIPAQGSPYLADFHSISAKRADLRLDVASHGLDMAFANWLRRERPYAYRQYAETHTRQE